MILGDGHCLETTTVGVVNLKFVLPDGVTKNCRLHDVLYVPDNLSKITKTGKRVNFRDARCLVEDEKGRVIATA